MKVLDRPQWLWDVNCPHGPTPPDEVAGGARHYTRCRYRCPTCDKRWECQFLGASSSSDFSLL